MNTKDLVHFAPTEVTPWFSPARPELAPSYHQLVPPLRLGILSARQHLLSQQRDDGTWLGHRHGNASLPSQLILLLAFRRREQSHLARQAAEAMLWQQLPAGGWSAVPAGPIDVSVSVQAYFALKLTGHAADDERLSLARTRIRESGGADAADAATRFFLALLGQIDYAHCPSAFHEIATLRPRLLAPMTVVSSERVVRDVELERGVRELFVKWPCDWPAPGGGAHAAGHSQSRGRRQVKATVARSRWEHCDPLFREDPDAVLLAAAIDQLQSTRADALEFDELVWHAVAMESLGMGTSDVAYAACESRLGDLVVVDEEEELAQPQPGKFPMVDTAITVRALRDSGLEPDCQVLIESVESWNIEPVIDAAGPAELAWCSEALAAVEPTGDAWGDALPPRIQMAENSLGRSPCCFDESQADHRSIACRLVERLLELQHADGGWGVEVKGKWEGVRGKNDFHFPSASPPPPSAFSGAPEVTGAVLEALSRHHVRVGHRAVDRAVAWLREAQQADGSWDSTTGVRYIHGTSWAVRGLVAAGARRDDSAVAAGVNWLLAHQQPSGGWGEAVPAPPHDPLFRSSPASATQTAWAVLALLAAGRVKHDAVGRGIQLLLDTQLDDGRWDEPQFTLRHTATGGWHRSELHSVVWPLMALSRWAVAASAAQTDQPDAICLRCFDDEAT